MRRYAENTSVSVENSKAEIERTLRRYGITTIGFICEPGRAQVGFQVANYRVRFDVKQGKDERENKRQWRVALLRIKSKLEEAKNCEVPFEEVFLANIVLPQGGTVGQWLTPQLALSYEKKAMPLLLEQ